MPNWVTNRVIITGPEEEIDRFRKEIIVPDDEGRPRLDFNRVIPRPEVFESGHGPDMFEEMAWTAWYGPDEPSPGVNLLDVIFERTVAYYLSMPSSKREGLKTREDLQQYVLRFKPQAKEAADRLERNRKNYGALSFYDWSVKNWGTKWNASRFELVGSDKGMMEILFDTAWAPPEPIFWELSRLYPDLRWDIKSFDEGFLFGMRGLIQNGEGSYDEVEATRELYEDVYGTPYEESEEE